MKIFTSKKQKIGKIGEDLACKHLINKGFTILERNYTKKWGEIDIIAEKEGTIYFIEVKSSSQKSPEENEESFFRPEENVHPWKTKRLRRIIETYLIQKRIGNTPWQFNIMIVLLNLKTRQAKIETMENIVL